MKQDLSTKQRLANEWFDKADANKDDMLDDKECVTFLKQFFNHVGKNAGISRDIEFPEPLSMLFCAVHQITGNMLVTREDMKIAGEWSNKMFQSWSSSRNPTLGYWGIRGNASAARYIMKYAKADFNMKEYSTPAEWGADKFNLGLDFPNIVYVNAGDYKLSEAAACYLYLAAKHCPDLTGKDPKCRGLARMLENAIFGGVANEV